MRQEGLELIRVSCVGTLGFMATMQLADVATLVSIAVGVATFTYVVTKLYFLIRNKGQEPKP